MKQIIDKKKDKQILFNALRKDINAVKKGERGKDQQCFKSAYDIYKEKYNLTIDFYPEDDFFDFFILLEEAGITFTLDDDEPHCCGQ